MKIPNRKSSFLFLGAFALDVLYTSGTFSMLAGSGIPKSVIGSIKTILGGTLTGLATNQLSKDSSSNFEIEKALQKALINTLESVEADFFRNDEYRITLRDKINFLLIDGVPTENIVSKKTLEEYFFNPMYSALSEAKFEEVLQRNKQLNPSEILQGVIENSGIKLPKHRKLDEEKINSVIFKGFQERFLYHFSKELDANSGLKTNYKLYILHTVLNFQETTIEGINKVSKGIQELIDFAKWEKIELGTILNSNDVLINQIEDLQSHLHESFENLRREFKKSYELSLTIWGKRKTDVRDQFRSESLFTSFQGRDKELIHLFGFLYDPRPFCWYAISGEGGMGKSRLANELCLKAEENRWICGFSDPEINEQKAYQKFEPNGNTLIVFDYVKFRKNEVIKALELLNNSYRSFKHNVRVLLLEREYGDDLLNDILNVKTRYSYYTYKENEKELPFKLKELDRNARWSIVQQIIKGVSHEDELNMAKDDILNQIENQDPLHRPLFTFLSAVALADGQNIQNWNTNQNLKYHIQRQEKKFWGRLNLWESRSEDIKSLLWLGATCEYLKYDDFSLAVLNESVFKTNWESLSESQFIEIEDLFTVMKLDEEDVLFGMKPDLLAEFFIVYHLEELLLSPRLKGKVQELLKTAWELRPERTWWMLNLTIQNFNDSVGGQGILDWLIDLTNKLNNSEFLGKLWHNYGLYLHGMNDENSVGFLKLAIAKGNIDAIVLITAIFLDKKDVANAEYYIEILKYKKDDRIHFLKAGLYLLHEQYDLAEENYLKAYENGFNVSLQLADLYYSRQEFAKAEKYLKESIKDGDLFNYGRLANVYQELGQPDVAEMTLIKGLENERSEWGLKELAKIYTDKGQYKDAEIIYEELLKSYPNKSYYNDIAAFYAKQGRDLEVARYIKLLAEHGQYEVLIVVADIFQDEGRLDIAEDYYLKAIERNVLKGYAKICQLYIKLGNSEKAREYYELAVEYKDPEGYIILGALSLDMGNVKVAENFFVWAADNGRKEGLKIMGEAYRLIEKDYVTAIKYFSEACKRGDYSAYVSLGDLLYEEMSKVEEAKGCYLKALEYYHYDANSRLGEIYEQEGDFELAEKHYLASIGHGDYLSSTHLGYIYRKQGSYDKAEDLYNLVYEKGYLPALNLLGMLYSEQSDHINAEKYFLRSLEEEPDNISAISNLADCYRHQEKYSLAENFYIEYREKEPNRSEKALKDLVNVYLVQKKFDVAEIYLLDEINGKEENLNKKLYLYYEIALINLKDLNYHPSKAISFLDKGLNLILASQEKTATGFFMDLTIENPDNLDILKFAYYGLGRVFEAESNSEVESNSAVKWYFYSYMAQNFVAREKLLMLCDSESSIYQYIKSNPIQYREKFTLPMVKENGSEAAFQISIVESLYDEDNPLFLEIERLRDVYNVQIPADVIASFNKLYSLAKENKVSFLELVVYSLKSASEEGED